MKNTRQIVRAMVAFCLTGALSLSHAGMTDLADAPFARDMSALLKPNIMLLMDTSSSMKFTHMPDQIEGANQGAMPVGYKSNQCNVLYYDPNKIYEIPKQANGSSLPTPSFGAARYNYYSTDPTVVDLATSFKSYDVATRQNIVGMNSDTAQPAYYYKHVTKPGGLWSGQKKPDAKPCIDTDQARASFDDSLGTGEWQRVIVSATSGPGGTDERQNFAIWYTYYRTRISMIKSAVSLAFLPLTDNFRVGFITVRPDLNTTDNYLAINDFNTTQRTNWYNKLFSQVPGGTSPSREGLARVGRHYAGKTDGINTNMTPDPVQYSCQQNFTIMTTDGYWNTEHETVGPVGLDGTTKVGQQDGVLDVTGTPVDDTHWTHRPIWDGGPDTKRVEISKTLQSRNDVCTSNYGNKTTAQKLQSTHQQFEQKDQIQLKTTQVKQTTVQNRQITVQNKKKTTQYWQSTGTLKQQLFHNERTTYGFYKSSYVYQQRTYENQQSQHQFFENSYENRAKTSQLVEFKYKTYKKTKQLVWYNPATELTEAVQTCPPGKTCTDYETGPTLVDSCGTTWPSASNNWMTTTCTRSWVQYPTGVPSCTLVSPTAANGYVQTDCQTLTENDKKVATCTVEAASAANSWTETQACSTANVVTESAVRQCTRSEGTVTDATSPFRVWVCEKRGVSGEQNKPVTSCSPVTPSASPWVWTTCKIVNDTGLQYSATACTPGSTTDGTSPYTVSACQKTPVTVPYPINDTCTPGETTGPAPQYLREVCEKRDKTTHSAAGYVTGQAVSTCTAGQAATYPYTITACAKIITSAWAPVASCTAGLTGGANYERAECTGSNTTVAYDPTTCVHDPANGVFCGSTMSAWTPVASCTAEAASALNRWTKTECQVVNGDTFVQSCTPSAAASGNDWTTTTCSEVKTHDNTPVESCTAQTASAGNSWATTTCDPTSSEVGEPDHATCISHAQPATAPSWVKKECVNSSLRVGTNTCSPVSPDAANGFTTTTCPVDTTTDVPVATCSAQTPNAGNGWKTISCRTATADLGEVANCTPVTANAGNAYTATYCAYLPGKKRQTGVRVEVTTLMMNGGPTGYEMSRSVVPTPAVFSDTLVGGLLCHPDASTLPGVNPLDPAPADRDATIAEAPRQGSEPASCVAWPCIEDTPIAGGSTNSLADVAQYYYVTDLRPTMVNDVKAKDLGIEDDRAKHQHMTTFVLGLGVSGSLEYRDNYKTATTGDFAMIRCDPRSVDPVIGCANKCAVGHPNYPDCSKSWPVWPDPAYNYTADASLYSNPRAIDDFWHTAVNGRGRYFSANDPEKVVDGLQKALRGIEASTGSGAGIAVTSITPTAGNNVAYRTNYTLKEWTGDLKAHSIDLLTGSLSTGALWSAQTLLDARVGMAADRSEACDDRKIWLFRSGATDNLTDFSWNTKTCDATTRLPTGTASTGLNATEQAFFGSAQVANLSQYLTMTDGSGSRVDQRSAAAGENLLNYIRGHQNREGPESFKPNDLLTLYRSRTHVLGDLVNSQPVYVQTPFAEYADTGYESFKASKATRTGMVYVGGNDGMLHAFAAADGKEKWAFVPSLVLPTLHKLADYNYASNHKYYVDGTPIVSDVYDTSGTPAWKSILVGGLNKGGKGYYALDVTDPDSPKGLWEFGWSDTCWDGTAANVKADCHVGYSYGRPIITKLVNGSWVVIVTSGLNNVNSPAKPGDGFGYLYVLDAMTGALKHKISTGAGNSATPSGLTQITNFVDNALINNTTQRVYGVDMLGNVWRFLNKEGAANVTTAPVLLGTVKAPSGAVQPISTRPEVAEIGNKPWVYIGTGRLLGSTDLADTQVQSVYAFKDELTTPTPATDPVYADLRDSLKEMTMTQSTVSETHGGVTKTVKIRTIRCTDRCPKTAGWVVDLPESKERVNVDVKLQLGTLTFVSNVPSTSVCTPGGDSWINYLNFRTGEAIATSAHGAVSRSLGSTLSTGSEVLRIGDSTKVISNPDDPNPPAAEDLPVDVPPPAGKRVSWREVLD